MTKRIVGIVYLMISVVACSNPIVSIVGATDASDISQPDATPDPSVITTILTRSQMCDGDWRSSTPQFAIGDESLAASSPFSFEWDLPQQHLKVFSERYQYKPTYNPSNVSFARNGRPIILDRSYVLQFLDDTGKWLTVDLMNVARTSFQSQGIKWEPDAAGRFAAPYSDKRVVFDKQCNVYVLMPAARYGLAASALLHSWDGGHSWRAYKVPNSEGSNTGAMMEMATHSHVLEQAPVLRIFHLYNMTDVSVVVPNIGVDGRVAFNGPFSAIAKDNALSLEVAGGGETQTVSIGDTIYLAYTAPKHGIDPLTLRRGMQAMVTAMSRSTGAIVQTPVELGIGVNSVSLGFDANGKEILDAHNQPTLASDADGQLHVTLGGHGGPLYYRRTVQAGTTTAWTPVEQIGERATPQDSTRDQYTYPSLLIRDGSPFVVARWTGDRSKFQIVTIERDKVSGQWSPQRILLSPGRTFYGHWYNKASLGVGGQIALSYSYVADQFFAEEKVTLENQFGFKLRLNPTVAGNDLCVPSSISAAFRKYCFYLGMPRIEEGDLLLGAGGAAHFLTAARLFEQ